ncbi:ectonucleotide pyrophosphatase/phosphodiesterase family member 1 [Plenodomus tracheiphilus IPT5]|uniref:Ectonucleotide pyrophosphatase/phosphodiesterase family member 1 n=1 Tax=Plenodomus tracheiphilus IPT5 TaxID=1408161 RepID=A0A6A7AXM6_9PLEO|nr:ectonucleotide pyrophosphatase/phosphodiesterase family member 1 [Plenodomus tracheiphilus IPT5]
MPPKQRNERERKRSVSLDDERTLHDNTSDSDYDGRPSGDLSDADHDILESEDEREKLLTRKDGIFGRKGSGVRIGKLSQKTEMSERKRGRSEEERALMYEMEEGVGQSSTSLRRRKSEESDEQRLRAIGEQRKAKRIQLWRRIGIYSAIVALFVVLLAAAYRLSTPKDVLAAAALVSNGTSLFAPTTILISLDGFRADFLYRDLTPTLNRFIQEGISPKYMLPSFPSVTFPNHYTMATGMYPEAHGVVGNSFWDPALEKEFYYTDPERSLQPHWWGGEPIWVTAEKQKVRAAVHMWPGSEAHIQEQEIAYIDKYNGSEVLPVKVNRIMDLLDVPGPHDIGAKATSPRPQLIAAYVPDVDGDGHRYGPNSTEIRKTIADADAMLGSILGGLHARNLTDIVNVIVVSDHGMATTDVSRLIQLEDLIDPSELSHIDGWPLYGLRPKNPEDLPRLHAQLKEKAKDNPNIEVYLRDEDMPARYHFANNPRIAPLWIVPKTGWAIVTKDEFDVEEGRKKGDVYHPRGLHGYDHEHPLMRAIFIARGPAFKHVPGSRMEPFQNIELYNIVCDSIGLTPAPNNGTLRLPLKPVGHHNDTDASLNETPEDPVPTLSTSSSSTSTSTSLSQSQSQSQSPLATMSPPLDSLSSITTSASGLDDTFPSHEGTVSHPTAPTTPTDSAPAAETSAKGKSGLWDWIAHKANEVEEWVDGFFVHKAMPGDEDGGGEKAST